MINYNIYSTPYYWTSTSTSNTYTSPRIIGTGVGNYTTIDWGYAVDDSYEKYPVDSEDEPDDDMLNEFVGRFIHE